MICASRSSHWGPRSLDDPPAEDPTTTLYL